MPRIYAKGNNVGISEITMDLIKEREQYIIYEQYEEAKETYKKKQKRRKQDRDIEIQRTLDEDLDLRDRWAGIRNLKKNTNQCHTTNK